MKQTKKELIEKIKTEIVWYARPKNFNMPKSYLQQMYDEAKKLGLVTGVEFVNEKQKSFLNKKGITYREVSQ